MNLVKNFKLIEIPDILFNGNYRIKIKKLNSRIASTKDFVKNTNLILQISYRKLFLI